MRSEAVVPLVATVVAWEFALALFRRWRATRRAYLRSWTLSLLFFAAGSAALWYGSAFGWTEWTFRSYWIFGAFLSVPWLAQGELELLARPAVSRAALAFVVILSLDGAITLAAAPFLADASVGGHVVPSGRHVYGEVPRTLVMVSNIVGTVVVVVGTLWSGWRSRRGGPAARSRFRGTLVILAGVLVAAAGGSLAFLRRVDSQAVTLAVGVTLMYAGFGLASRRPGSHRRDARRRDQEAREATLAPGEPLVGARAER